MEASRCLFLCMLFFVDAAKVLARLDELKTEHDYMNICLKGRNHKTLPGSEAKLFSQCSPWTSRSCCTQEVSEQLHLNRNWLNFDWDHCKDLSPRCREHFIQDLCFYECSPNVGPWLVQDVRKIRKERFVNVPLCSRECENWWEDCKDDSTCVENWAAHFNWSSGINTCPEGNTCRPFKEIYNGSSHFCETLMGGSFKVVPDEDPMGCFYFWFDPKYPNPNEEVARRKVAKILGKPYKVVGSGSNDNGCTRMSVPSDLLLTLFFVCAFVNKLLIF